MGVSEEAASVTSHLSGSLAVLQDDPGAVSAIQALMNTGILNGYLAFVWSEWGWLAPWACGHMCTVIKESFGVEGMKGHRDEPRGRLYSVKGRLDLGLI